MARKPKPWQPPAPAAPQGAHGEWKARVAALLERKDFRPASCGRSDGAICSLLEQAADRVRLRPATRVPRLNGRSADDRNDDVA